MRKFRNRLCFLVVFMFIMIASQLCAAEKKEITIDPTANRILKEMSEYLQGADQFAIKSDVFYDVVMEGGQKIRYTAGIDSSIKRPNKFQSNYTGDLSKRRVWYDGDALTIFQPKLNFYASIDTKSTIDEAVAHVRDDFGVGQPLSDFILSNPYKDLIKDVQAGHYLGQHELHGYKVHHLLFVQEDIDWEIWVEDGRMLVPRMLVITYKKAPSFPQYTLLMYDWDFSVRFPDSLFSPRIPEGAQKIDFIKVAEEIR